MKTLLLIALTLAAAVYAAPMPTSPDAPPTGITPAPKQVAKSGAITYRVVNDCYKETVKEVPIVLPDGKVAQGITCTVAPHVVADTAKADTTSKK